MTKGTPPNLSLLALSVLTTLTSRLAKAIMFLDYFALFLLIFVAVVMFYGVIAIHDIPYEIAKRRNHPQQDALHVAGWISLFTLHVLWPFLWIWATLYREDRGWGFQRQTRDTDSTTGMAVEQRLQLLNARLDSLEAKVDTLANSPHGTAPVSTPPEQA